LDVEDDARRNGLCGRQRSDPGRTDKPQGGNNRDKDFHDFFSGPITGKQPSTGTRKDR
jgi:hypothetical protein